MLFSFVRVYPPSVVRGRRLCGRACFRAVAALPAFVVLSGLRVPAVRAQTPAATAPASAAAPATDPDAVVANINDLGLLRALLPLKLTGEQTTALARTLRSVEQDTKTRVQQDEAGVRALAGDVETARTNALAGTPIPAELEARVVAAKKAAQARERTVRAAAIQKILAAIKESLTPEQQKQIAAQAEAVQGGRRVPREFANNPDKAPASVVQDLSVAYFIEQVLLNPRAALVLSQMKPAAAAAPAPAAAIQ